MSSGVPVVSTRSGDPDGIISDGEDGFLVDRDDPVIFADHYRMADIFVMPSTGEGFGIVFLEAMACGLPAVGLDMDGSVDPLETAALGHPVNEAELESTIENILSAPPPRARPDYPFATEYFSRHLSALVGGVV